MIACVWWEEMWRRRNGCCWWIRWEIFLLLLLSAWPAGCMSAQLAPRHPLAALRTLGLVTRSPPAHTAHEDSSTSESSRRHTRPAGSAVVDLHAHLGGARHLSATLNGRFTSLPVRAAQQSESAIRAHQQRCGPRAKPHARTHRRGCTVACAAGWIVSLTTTSGRRVHVKLRSSTQQQCGCQTQIKQRLCIVLLNAAVGVRRSCHARLRGARRVRLRENYFCG